MLNRHGVRATVHPLPAAAARGSDRSRARAVTHGLGLVLGAGILVGGMVHATAADARALRELPAGARAELYARTLQNLESVCAPGNGALPEFCDGQARLALAFPECDGACVELARTSLRQPTR
jgi:hypothetical protein